MASKKVSEKKLEACIIIAGNPGSGKSTVLNNVFNLKLKTGSSPSAVTKIVEKKKLKKEKVYFTVIDTPGLGDPGLIMEKVVKDIKKSLQSVKDYTLLFCLRVDAGNRVTEEDQETIEMLQKALGVEVWNKCVILLTFSDTAHEEQSNDDDYKAHLKEFSSALNEAIKLCNPENEIPDVRTAFEFGVGDIYERDEGIKDIIAFPVGVEKKCGAINILPGILEVGDDWTDLLFLEIMRKTPETNREAFIILKYGKEVIGVTGVAASVGAGVGAAVGALGGAIGGPLGMVAGAGVGALVGGGVAALTGFTIASIRSFILQKKAQKNN